MARSGAVRALLEPRRPAVRRRPAPAAQLAADTPAFLLFTSGTEGGPKGALHRRGYVAANRLQAERWMGVRPGDRVWCTAATGWSKSLRNVVAGGRAVRRRDGASTRAGSTPPSGSS